MRLSFKKKDVPLDLIFSDIAMTIRDQFIDSFKGEIRSFNGLRGYAKAKLSKNSDLEIIIKPYKNHSINMVISGNNAGELLRRDNIIKMAMVVCLRHRFFTKIEPKCPDL